jgi:hypothetical protein
MKEYTPARLLECHHENEDGDPIPCPGLCPKLVIKSAGLPGNPQLGPDTMHAVVFSEAEVRTLVREADRGYFDLPDMPERKDSRFWDPLTAMLMDALQTNPVRALGILLFLGQPEAIAFVQQPEPILAMQDIEGEWTWIYLNGQPPTPVIEAADDQVLTGEIVGVDQPAEDDEDIDVPQGVTAYNTDPPTGATILWTRPTTDPINPEDRYDVTDHGNAALNS